MLDHVDLLFTEMASPGMQVPALAKVPAAERPGLRTIYASGYTDDAMFRSQAAEGPPPYVAKPFTAEVLLARVREVLDAPRSPQVRG